MSTIVWLWLAANAVAFAGLAVEISNLGVFARLRARGEGEAVDVYVAMRDEAENASAFLDSTLALSNVAMVVVADDASSDATGAIVQRYVASGARVRYLSTSGGKAKALAHAVAAFPPRSPWLLFLDADVRLAPGAAAALVAYARERNASAATAWLRVDTPTVWSTLLAPAVTLFLLQVLPMRAARGTDPRFSAGNGQCFAIARDAYAASGGHEALDDVVEDVALARALKRAGFTVALASGADVGVVRGYESLGQNLRGLGRSLYYGAGAAGCAFVLIWQCCLAVSPVPLYLARAVTRSLMRESLLSVVLAPLGAAFGAFAALFALVEGSTGRIAWRGRAIPRGETAARP